MIQPTKSWRLLVNNDLNVGLFVTQNYSAQVALIAFKTNTCAFFFFLFIYSFGKTYKNNRIQENNHLITYAKNIKSQVKKKKKKNVLNTDI